MYVIRLDEKFYSRKALYAAEDWNDPWTKKVKHIAIFKTREDARRKKKCLHKKSKIFKLVLFGA